MNKVQQDGATRLAAELILQTSGRGRVVRGMEETVLPFQGVASLNAKPV